jgi:hypothetical protein
MGMYRLGAVNGDPTTKTDGAVSLNTTTLQLSNKTYDAAKTAAMNLPSTVNGAAFANGSGSFTYIIWAKTTTDRSEVASATYSFPTTFNIGTMTKRAWDNSLTNSTATISSQSIVLTGSPIFLNAATFIPVELVDFKGKVEKNKHILSWHTATEVNADYFEVEKSEDGINFGPLSINAKIKAFGNTSTPQNYATTDDNVSIGLTYYRLRMVDLDGKEKYSNVISLQAEGKLSVKIAPNPFEKTLSIDVNSALNNDVITAELLDLSGRILIKKTIETTEKTTQLSFDTEGSPAGFYIVRLSNKSSVLQKKVVKH